MLGFTIICLIFLFEYTKNLNSSSLLYIMNAMFTYRVCKVCEIEFRYESRRGRPSDFCSDKCREKFKKKYMKDYQTRINNYQKYIETHRRNNRKIRVDRKNLCLIHYGGNSPKCACCGEDEIRFLCIDHIHGGGNQHIKKIRREGANFYYWLIKNGFPEGFQVLCYNCNRAKGRIKVRFCPVHHPELYN